MLPALIADGNGIVLLSSAPEWRYTYLRPLLPEIEAEFSATRQFEGQALKPFSRAIAQSRQQWPAPAHGVGFAGEGRAP